MLTIIMYHYVRDLSLTKYPHIKGLLTKSFEGQLDYISGHYTVCSMAQVLAASRGAGKLPHNACILSFDDGLTDHYETVFPRLLDYHFTGVFFPSARPIEEHCVLDVHKMQFILAATIDYQDLVKEILIRVEDYRDRFAISPDSELWENFAVPNRYDPIEVAFIKKILQWALPEQVRSEIIDELFAKHVSGDEAGFSGDLYMSASQLKEMISSGMEVGGHGYNHAWLGKLSRNDQALEIQRTASFLGGLFGHRLTDWTMCYPFGSYNTDTMALVSEAGCAVGLTTKVGLADLSHPLELERVDTNDLPPMADCDFS